MDYLDRLNVTAERERAATLGITLRGDARYDRPVEDRRGPNACPTCRDGIVTIASPSRCRECVRGGL